MPEYEQKINKLGLVHWTGWEEDDLDPVQEDDISGREVRMLRTWVEQMLRFEDNRGARQLLSILNSVVYEQAREQGTEDALKAGIPRVSKLAGQVWQDGYTVGFAEGMNERNENEIDEKEAST